MFKKKFLSIPILILLVLSLTGCTIHIENNFGYRERRFTLELYNDCKCDIYGYQVPYMLDGKPAGSMGASNANESEVSDVFALKMIFTEKDFPEDYDLSKFEIEISVLDKEMKESEPTDVISWAAEYGKSYNIRVGGSFEDGFEAERE